MALVQGKLTKVGAVIDVLVGVNSLRRQMLAKHKLRVPEPVPVRVVIDTGSTLSGLVPSVFTRLEIGPIDRVEVYTPSTTPDKPHLTDVFAVTLWLVVGAKRYPRDNVRVITADCFHESEHIEGLLGRDILNHCNFIWTGKERKFQFGF